jgi:dehydrogenase/reductase SDR family protein 12
LTLLADSLRGAAFFSLFWPSFSNLGYLARRRLWQPVSYDFSGQTWLVTGASTGIGREIALSAANAGARVIAVARSANKLQALEQAVTGAGRIEPQAHDLSLLGEIDQLAAQGPPLTVLVNNVGVMFERPELTAEGLDAGFVTNLLGHYRLTEALLANGCVATGSTVINMSSGGAYNVPLRLSPLHKMMPYNGTLAYAYQKRAQLALNAHWRERYWDRAQFYVMHPGWVDTPGVAQAMPEFRAILRPLLRDAAAGADTALWLAALRPAQRGSQGVWFDRALCPAHYLPGTRTGADRGELLALLEAAVQSPPD